MAAFYPNAINSKKEEPRYAQNGVASENDFDIQHVRSDVGQPEAVLLSATPVQVNSHVIEVSKSTMHEKTVIPSHDETESSTQKLPSKEVLVNSSAVAGQQMTSSPTVATAGVGSNDNYNIPVSAVGSSIDEVDGEISSRRPVAISINELSTLSPKPQARNNIPQSDNTSTTLTIDQVLAELLKDLTARVVVYVCERMVYAGTASLLWWWTWTNYKRQRSLNELSGTPTSLELMIRVENTFAAKLKKIIGTVVVDFIIKGETVTVPSWAATSYQNNGDASTCLVCKTVPIRVCEYLENSYGRMCDLLSQIKLDPSLAENFYIIGHCNGVEKKINIGKLRKDLQQTEVLKYERPALDETASSFIVRTMKVSFEECTELLNKIYPGDQSVFVIHLGNDLDRLKHLYRK